jgi:hypothetical protein
MVHLRSILLCSVLGTLPLWSQDTTDQPAPQMDNASVAVVVDTSAAARDNMSELKKGVSTFLASFSDDDEVCLFTAGGKPQLVEEFTADTSLVAARVEKLKTQGPLSLSEAVTAARQHIQAEAGTENTAVVVFLAGDHVSSATPLLADSEQGAPVPVHVITTPGTDWRVQELLQKLTANTGGTAFFPASSQQFREVAAEAGHRIAGELPAETVATTGNAARVRKSLAPYDEVVVRNIPVADTKETQEFAGGDNLLIHNLLFTRLQKAKVFRDVIDGSNEAPPPKAAPNSEPGRRMEILATLVEFRRGNRIQRQFIGWKGGARVKLQVLVVDAATRQPLMSFVKEATSSVGPFGGSQELVQTKAMLNVVNQIVKELRRAKGA